MDEAKRDALWFDLHSMLINKWPTIREAIVILTDAQRNALDKMAAQIIAQHCGKDST